MLSLTQVDDFLMRVGVQDMNYSVTSKDTFGDIISVFDPDMKYSTIRNAVNNSRPMRNKIVDSGTKYLEIHDDVYIDGNRVRVAILCEEGDSGFGTIIKVMVKTVDVFIGDEMKSFLSFESMKNYISRIQK